MASRSLSPRSAQTREAELPEPLGDLFGRLLRLGEGVVVEDGHDELRDVPGVALGSELRSVPARTAFSISSASSSLNGLIATAISAGYSCWSRQCSLVMKRGAVTSAPSPSGGRAATVTHKRSRSIGSFIPATWVRRPSQNSEIRSSKTASSSWSLLAK